jgi:outer membrane protein assembly factor BamB
MTGRTLVIACLVAAACGGPPELPAGPRCAAPPRAPAAPALPLDPAARGQLAWGYEDPTLTFLGAQPALGASGAVYATSGIRLVRLSTAGQPSWMAPSSEAEPLVPTPLADEAGRIWVASGQVALYAFAEDGTRLLRVQLDPPPAEIGGEVRAPVRLPSGIALAAGGRVYFMDDCGALTARYDHPRRLAGAMIAFGDGVVAIEPEGAALVGIGPGGLRWRAALGDLPTSLAASADAIVAASAGSASVFLVDPRSGTIRARTTLAAARVAAPIWLGSSEIVLGATDPADRLRGWLHALDGHTLAVRWSAALSGQITLLPVATAAGIVVGVSDGRQSKLALIDASGQPRWEAVCDGCSFGGTAPALDASGTLYAAAVGRMVALRVPAALEPRSPWPRADGADDGNRARPAP